MYETQPDGGSSHGKVSQETLLSSGILSSYHLHLKLGGDVKHSRSTGFEKTTLPLIGDVVGCNSRKK